MGAKANNSKTYNAPYEYFLQKMRCIDGAGFNFSTKSENPMPDGVWFRIIHGFSAKSYGEKITVTLKMLAQGGVWVDVHSECGMPTQLFDMGKNKQNVELIFSYLENGMPAPAVQQNTAAPQAGKRFCPHCGKPVTPGSAFCAGCGNRL